jgi:hypothetical protein
MNKTCKKINCILQAICVYLLCFVVADDVNVVTNCRFVKTKNSLTAFNYAIL